MAYFPNNPNGQATSANSAPVVLSSNQSPSLVAQDDTIVILARILKLLESLSIVDSAQRQRVVVDAFGAGLSVTVASGNITVAGTVAVSSLPATPAGANIIGSLNNLGTIAGMDREMYINQARVAYNTGISAKLN
jgi:hypothetical protein